MPLQLGRDRAFDPTNRAFSNDSPKAEVFLFLVFGEVFFLSRDRAFDQTNRSRCFCLCFFSVWEGLEWQHTKCVCENLNK